MSYANAQIILCLLVLSISASAQWLKHSVETTAGFRGLSVVNEKIVWASGTGGTVIKTIDAGKTWKIMTVPGAEKLDFRDIEAFDANTAYILSIGNGDSSRIYKTTDGGATWNLQFTNKNEKAFFDALACWDASNCVAMSDPVDRRYVLIGTKDGGKNWHAMDTDKMAYAKEGEAAFAASGTCLITQGKNYLYLVTGGSEARVFRSYNRGLTWFDSVTPITRGTAGSGIFSIAMKDGKNGIIVGGDYEKPDQNTNNVAFTSNGGRSWKAGTGVGGYRSGVTYIDPKTIVAAGSGGSDITLDGGKTWTRIDSVNYNAVQAKGKKAVWAVGPKGLVSRLDM